MQEISPSILLVAATTGYQTRSFADAARRQGLAVTLATDRCHILEDPWRDHAIPVKFDAPEPVTGVVVDGIVAVADRPTLIAALTAQSLGLPWHPPEAVKNCRDKSRSRQIFKAAGLPSPWSLRVPLEDTPEEVVYPCVLKPLGLSGSRGVIRANNRPEFLAAFERIRRILHAEEERSDSIQVEEYIPGREFALEGLMTNGELKVLAIFDKPDLLDGPFFEETIYVTPSRAGAEVCNAIVETTRKAVRALGLRHGPVHAEMRVNETGAYMLEIAARPIGGLCARALRFAGGLTLEDVVVLHAIGRTPDDLSLADAASGVMMIPIPRSGIYQGVSGIAGASAVAGIDDVVITAKKGQMLLQLPEGASYLGFIFARGADPATVENSLRLAHAELKFEVATTLDVVFF